MASSTSAISWSNLTVTTTSKATKMPQKTILSNLTGDIKTGSLLAVMGPTGSGKTTLLNALGHRFETELNYQGVVRFNGEKWQKDRKSQVGFVEQDDIVIDVLTVRQSLRFVAELRLPDTMSLATRLSKIELVVKRLRLTKCLDSKVADISGGERKRLCIAQELIVEPKLILLDEPTSGLDSTTAKLVVEYLQELSNQEQNDLTILATIHQPSSQVFHMFTNLLLLSEGRTVFHGASQDAVQYFNALGFICPINYNPADHFMDLVVLGKLDTSDIQNRLYKDFTISTSSTSSPSSPSPTPACTSSTSSTSSWIRYARPWQTQVSILVRRMWLVEQQAQFTLQNVILYFGLAIICAILWIRIGYQETDIFKRTSLCFWLVGTWTFFPLFNALFAFGLDQILVGKELSINSYRLSAYYVSKSLVSLPAFFLWAFIYHVIVHFVTGLNDSFSSYILLYLTIMLNILATQGIGLSISAGVSQEYILTSCILCVTAMFSYGGFFVPMQSMSPIYSWIVYIDPIHYAFRLVTGVVFGSYAPLEFQCGEMNETIYPQSCGRTSNSRTISSVDVLNSVGTGDLPLWISAAALGVIAVVTRSLAYCVLRYKWVILVQQKEMKEVFEVLDDTRLCSMKSTKSGGKDRKDGSGDGNEFNRSIDTKVEMVDVELHV